MTALNSKTKWQIRDYVHAKIYILKKNLSLMVFMSWESVSWAPLCFFYFDVAQKNEWHIAISDFDLIYNLVPMTLNRWPMKINQVLY